MTAGYILIWLLVFVGPYGRTIHPIHFPTLRACMIMASAPQFEDVESECVSVSRPVILPLRSPLSTPMESA